MSTAQSGGSDAGPDEEQAATVRSPSGAEVAEITHGSGVLTRLSSDAVVSRQADRTVTPGQPVSLRIHVGSSWHRLWSGPNRAGIEVQTPAGSITADDGAFSVVCEPSGACFVVSLEGTVTVKAGGRDTVLQPLQAMDVSAAGDVGSVIDVSADEVASDPWITLNLELEASRAAAAPASWSELPPLVVEAPADAPAHSEPAPEPEPEEAVAADAAPEAAPEPEPEAESEVAPEPEPAPAASEAAATAAAAAAAAGVAEPASAESDVEPADETAVEPAVETATAPGVTPADVTSPVAVGAGAAAAGHGAAGAEHGPEHRHDDSHVVEVARPRQTSPVRVAVLLLLIAGAILFFINVDNKSTQSNNGATAIDQQQVTNTTLPGDTTGSEPPATAAPGTEPPTTAPRTTSPPTTAPPTTAAPATTAPPARPAPAPAGSYDATLASCHQAADGSLTATGTIRNKGTAPTHYRITVNFVTFDANNNEVPVAQAVADVPGVAPGQQPSWTASGSSGADLRHQRSGCRIAAVDTVP